MAWSARTADNPLITPRGGLLTMRWHDLLFAHWPAPADRLRAWLPRTDPPLELDLFDGQAWLGVVPFRMSGIGPRGLPRLPGASAFPECNLRTYVRAGGHAGVWFFSLDAASRLAVRVARAWFKLPYFDAAMECRAEGEGIAYRSRRTHRGQPPAEVAVRYRPTGPASRSAAGSFDEWATQRLSLFAAGRDGRLWRGDIAHAPWPLQPAAAEFASVTLAEPLGLGLAGPPAALLFVREIAVSAWTLRPAAAPRG